MEVAQALGLHTLNVAIVCYILAKCIIVRLGLRWRKSDCLRKSAFVER